jgi:hypothetical protein
MLQAKIAFEERVAQTCGHAIESFRADNIPFNSKGRPHYQRTELTLRSKAILASNILPLVTTFG